MELDQQGLTTSDYFWMDKLADVVSGYGDDLDMSVSMTAITMSSLTLGLICLAVTLSSVTAANKVLRQTIP